jgi:predicted nucleic acid-binding protein
LQVLPAGKRRSLLIRAFEEVLEQLDRWVAPFDVAAAQHAADLMAARQKKGRPGDLRDSMIAGIVLAQHASLATRNTAQFEDIPLPVINPWTA